MGYKPSPRPSFEVPTVIRAADAVRHRDLARSAGATTDSSRPVMRSVPVRKARRWRGEIP